MLLHWRRAGRGVFLFFLFLFLFFVFFGGGRDLLNDIWRVVRFGMYVLDYVIWFLVGSVSAVVL